MPHGFNFSKLVLLSTLVCTYSVPVISAFQGFKRLSLWSFRVSTPFSLLCLILLTDFHKNAGFRPIMLNYLNTALTFGKQTKDNFINGKVQCRYVRYAHSFSCPLFLWGESRGQQP